MIAQSLFSTLGFLLAMHLGAAGAETAEEQSDETYSKSSTCEAFDTSRDVTDYSARLVAHIEAEPADRYEIQLQAVHAKGMASPIRKITLNDGAIASFTLLEDNCICGMRINDVDVECTHITIYSVSVTQETLEAAADDGLAMTFLLDNGRIVAGPRFGPEEINKTLQNSS